jgi:hypothetical protein
MLFLPAIWALLGPFLVSITGSIVARVLLALGMGVVSYAVLSTLASNFVSQMQSNYDALNGVVLTLLNMAGGGVSLGIIGSALITRASLMAIKKLRVL